MYKDRPLTKELLYQELYNRHNGEFFTLKELPYPKQFKDMERALKRVVEAIECKEKIAIVGDYDVDGTVATTIMRELFVTIGYEVEWIIPNRFRDGYGLSKGVVDKLNADLIITVDNGIAAVEAAKVCKERGIDLIITDHHSIPPTVPEAYAIINQKQSSCPFPFKEICGAQIAWYFAVALCRKLNVKVDANELLALASLAIVADIMPLTGINRTMLLAGIAYLKRSKKPFIDAMRLKGMVDDSLSSEKIAFYIAPLINSAGRLKDASIASNMLFSRSLTQAQELLEELTALNNERKAIEKEITAKALKQVNSSDKIAIVWGEDWHEGVIGIVASKVAEHYKVPAIVLSCKDGICKGSGRSYGDCDLYALVAKTREYYLKFGGHKSALGLSLEAEKLPLVKQLLNIEAASMCKEQHHDASILGLLPFDEIDFETLEILEKFEPYGEANPKPKFVAKGVSILECKDVGKNAEHRSYYLKHGNKSYRAIEFRTKDTCSSGDTTDIHYRLSRNNYNGKSYINLTIEHIEHSNS
ncbi:MAG TPA: single-stranded-DNA-specific exonuclease RecJ [Nitratifractor sp.]|nr:single-stranded-DNA-specific exonuclease RecJ [Nitratifractor sp.]